VQPAANLLDGRQRLPGGDRPLDQITHDGDRVPVVGGREGQQAASVVEFGLRVRLGGEPAAAARPADPANVRGQFEPVIPDAVRPPGPASGRPTQQTSRAGRSSGDR
jgi:hypothetical protein